MQDLHYGLRLFAAQRGFSLVAVLTLALGVGLSTALFSVIHATVLRPLPYPEPERLVSAIVHSTSQNGEKRTLSPSLDDVRRWRDDQRVFSRVGIERGELDVNIDAGIG